MRQPAKRAAARIRTVLPLALLTAVMLPAWGCAPREDEVLGIPAQPSIAVINAAPGEHLGRPVTLTGVVRLVRQPGVFVIGPTDSAAGSEILVMSRGPGSSVPDLSLNDVVRVTGTVRRFSPELQTEAGPSFQGVGPQVDPVFYATWRDRPVIVATAVDRLQYPLP